MLIDRFGRTVDYLRVSVTDRCDLRCNYCIPKGYRQFEARESWLTSHEIIRVIKTFAKLGTHSIRLTGGEPLLRKDIVTLVNRISKINVIRDLTITTNGTQLLKLSKPLYDAGLHRLNVSLDSLKQSCLLKITGTDCLNQILKGLEEAKKIGLSKIRINMVPIPGQNLDDIDQMVQFCIEHNFILCLIEVMPMGKTGQHSKTVNLQPIIRELKEKYKLYPIIDRIGNGPARYWKSSQNTSFKLGLITPLSQHFCKTCNRVRLSVDGILYTCLGQNDQMPLRPLLRSHCSDAELEQAITQAILSKPKSHNFLEKPNQINRIMAKTGG